MAQKLGTERQGAHILSPWIYRGLLSAIYLWAGLAKFADLSGAANSLRNYHIMPEAILPFASMALPSVEIILGVLLLVKIRPWVPFASALLATQFLIANSSAVIRGLDISCGCFGSYSSSVDIKVLALNVVMIVMSCALTARYTESDSRLTGRQTFVGASLLLVVLTSLSIWWQGGQQKSLLRLSDSSKGDLKIEGSLPSDSVTPPVELIPIKLDFGEMKLGDVKKTSMTLINHTEKPIRVTSIGIGCQCVEVNIPETTLQPGLGTPLTVTYTAGPKTGPLLQSIGFKFDTVKEPLVFPLEVNVLMNR